MDRRMERPLTAAVASRAARIAARAAIVAIALGGMATSAAAEDFSPELKALIAAADKEGELRVTWSANTFGGPKGAKQFEDGINKAYGTHIHIKWSPGHSMPAVGAEIAMRYANGLDSPTDVYMGFSRNMAQLLKYKMFLKAPYQKYAPDRLTDEVVEQDGTLVKVQSATVGFSYNKERAPFQPKTLADLLRPEWTGKIATTPYGAGFDQLAGPGMWGPEETVAWAKKFSKQVSGFLRCSDTDRLVSGEFLVLAMDCSGSSTYDAIADGAPLGRVIPPEMTIVSYFYLGVPKNSVHPNAGRLFIVYALSQEGQDLIRRQRPMSDLHLLPGSETGKVIHGLEKEYGRKFVNADIAWQLSNKAGNAAQRRIKKMLTHK